jgi:2'-5' RNA ligase
MANGHSERIRDHWYWRPGWSVGRRFYTWHITFADQPEVRGFAAAYDPALSSLPCLDLIPARWLHLTMQGIGFVDEVEQTAVEDIIEHARARCAQLEPFELSIGAPHVDPESVQIAVSPAEPVRQLRAQVRAAIADVWGSDSVPEAEGPFNPHLSLAYTNRDADSTDVRLALGQVAAPSATAHITECQLIVLNRDNRMYEWEPFATVHLGLTDQ